MQKQEKQCIFTMIPVCINACISSLLSYFKTVHSFNSKATEAKDAEDAAKDAEQRVLVLNAEVLEAERKSQAALANLQAEVLFFLSHLWVILFFLSSFSLLSLSLFWIFLDKKYTNN